MHIVATVYATAMGFIIGSVGGALLGVWLGVSPFASRLLSPYLNALNALPKVALAPLFVLWFGLGIESKIALAAVLVLFGEGPDGPDVLLTQRAATLRKHAGQPAFPGGRIDPDDDGPVGAALREAREETGLNPSGCDVLAVLHALIDAHLEHLALLLDLLAVALLAAILCVDLLAGSAAVGARLLHLLYHGTQLPEHNLDALTVAALASLHSTLLTTAAVTLGADDALLQGKLGNLAAVDILERDLVNVVDGASLLGAGVAAAEHAAHATESSASTAAAEELCEQVLGSHASAAAHSTALLKALLAILVVDLALLGV